MTSRYPGGLIRKNAANTSITGASGVWDLGLQAQAVKNNTWPISGLALPVSGSLRFRNSASAYLNRTPGSAGNRQTWTWSAWVKRGALGTTQALFGVYTDNNNRAYLHFQSGDTIAFLNRQSSVTDTNVATTSVFRDTAAWYHIILSVDTTQATGSNRIKLFVNNVQQTLTFTTTPSQNTNLYINTTQAHKIGDLDGTVYFDGYMAEINLIDGQALTPASFGQTSPITGVWEPIKYTGTYGTNGFYLSLSDTSSIGKDFSGNGNNWTPNNISTASGATFDLMRDVPTQWAPQGATDVGGVVRGNYCVLSPIGVGTYGVGTITNAGLTVQTTVSGTTITYGSFAFPSTGKWYWEFIPTAGSTGVFGPEIPYYSGIGNSTFTSYIIYEPSGNKTVDGTITSYGATYTTNDVIGVAVDTTNGTVAFYKNGVSQGNISYSFAGKTMHPAMADGSSTAQATFNVNFGQQPFAYAPPSGFVSLCSTNLPTPTIGATTATAANKYFDATLYTGTGATLSVTNAGGFQPDFVWLKSRSATTNHHLYDAVRGATKVIVGNTNESESTSANTITSFNSGGFTVGTNTAINTSSATYVGWQWNAGGSTVTNTTGSISSQVRASTTAGFSVVTYTGNGSAGATIGHGLGAAPSMLMFKNRDETGGNSILVWHTGFNTNQGQMLLNSTAAIFNPGNGLYFNSTTPGSSVVTLGTSGATNPSGQNMVMWAWTAIAGFSAFGSYTGNGSTDGPFVYTGFRPRFILVKCTTNAENWYVGDSARQTYNASTNPFLNPNLTDAENNSYAFIDLISNGFKCRFNGADTNASGRTYIYAAFAEHPFKNALAR